MSLQKVPVHWWPAIAFLYGLAARVYFVGRYGGRWIDSDTLNLASTAEWRWATGVAPPWAELFSSGVGQPLLAGLASRSMGLTIVEYQQLVHPILGVVVLGGAWVLARQLFSDHRLQALTIFLMAVAPEVAFETARGSHGAVAHASLLFLLACLVRAFRGGHESQGPWILLATVFMGGVAVMNLKRGIVVSSVVVTVLLVWVLASGIRGTWKASARALLILAPFVLLIIVAGLANQGLDARDGSPLGAFRDQIERILGGDATTPAPQPPAGTDSEAGTLEGYMRVAWGSPARYWAFSAANPILLALGFGGWILLARRLFDRRRPLDPSEAVVWGALTALGAWFVIVAAGAYWLGILDYLYPVRIFAYFSQALVLGATVFAAAMAAAFRPARRHRLLPYALVLGFVWLAVATPIKVGGEPALNAHWRFVTPEEILASSFAGRERASTPLWFGPDDPGWDSRIWYAGFLAAPGSPRPPLDTSQTPRSWIDSPTVALQAERLGVPRPDPSDYHRVYSNGGADVYVRALFQGAGA